MKKILFVITKSNWGGAQRYVYDLATGFKKAGATVKVVFGGTGEVGASYGTLASNLQQGGIQGLFVNKFTRDIYFLREFGVLKDLKFVFEKERPDIVHLNSSKAGGIGALAGRLARVKKIVFTSHGLPYDEDISLAAKTFRWIATWATFLLCHEVILISKDTYRRARKFPFCRNKMHLVYNGIPQLNFVNRDDGRRNIVGIPIKDVPWIGTIAEFTKNKGLSYMVEAASILKKRGLEFRFCLIGDGEDMSKVKAQAIKSGLYNTPGSSSSIDLPGFVARAASEWMKAFAIFVLPSVKEGLPYVLLEAGQASCAVVGSHIPGITDLIDDSTGILVPPKDPEALANALENLLRDPVRRRQLGEHLHTRVMAEFSLESMLSKTEEVYLSP